jgi:VWFA-related protein
MKSAGRVSTRVVLLVIAALGARASAQNPPQPPTPQDQRPVFRSGTDVVRVDVYPRHRGRIVTGLTPEDFRVTEDGTPQTIETFEFIAIAGADSAEEPLEPRNADEARRMAADPRNRVFIFYLDAYSVDMFGSARAREPILGFLQRSMGPRDLFAVMTSVQSPELLEFTRLTQGLGSVLSMSKPWGLEDRIPEGPEEEQLEGLCGRGVVAGRRMLKVLNDLDGLVKALSAMRPERKNLIFVGNRWQNEIGLQTMPSGAFCRAPSAGAVPLFDAAGQRGRGSFQPPAVLTEGADLCRRARAEICGVDFTARTREIFERAQRENVAVYFLPPAPKSMANFSLARSFADQTDGLSIVNNDISLGLSQVLGHQTGYYMIGYRSTKGGEDARLREVRVRVSKPDVELDVRRLYDPVPRAVTIASMTPPRERTDLEKATDVLARFRAEADVFIQPMVRAAGIELVLELAPQVAAREPWRGGAAVTATVLDVDGRAQGSGATAIAAGERSARLVIPIVNPAPAARVRLRLSQGDVTLADDAQVVAEVGMAALGRGTLFRAGSLPRLPYLPAADLRFSRTDRLRLEWPAAGVIAAPVVRLLNAAGAPLNADIVVSVLEGAPAVLRADLRLLSLAPGDYIVEAAGTVDAARVRQLTGIRVTR